MQIREFLKAPREIEENNDFRRVGGEMGKGSEASGAVAALRLVDHLRAVLPSDFGGAIGRAVVRDDDPANQWTGNLAEDVG